MGDRWRFRTTGRIATVDVIYSRRDGDFVEFQFDDDAMRSRRTVRVRRFLADFELVEREA